MAAGQVVCGHERVRTCGCGSARASRSPPSDSACPAGSDDRAPDEPLHRFAPATGPPQYLDSATHYDDGSLRPSYNRGSVEWDPLWKTLVVLTAALAAIEYWGYTGLLIDAYALVGVPLIAVIVWFWRGR